MKLLCPSFLRINSSFLLEREDRVSYTETIVRLNILTFFFILRLAQKSKDSFLRNISRKIRK